MARQRVIHPSIWTSDSFNDLTLRQRLLFIGLFSTADDYGRGRASPGALKIQLFALDEVRVQEIGKDLSAVAAAGMVTIYESGDKTYYELPMWWVYQKQRNDRLAGSTIPTPLNQTKDLRINSPGAVRVLAGRRPGTGRVLAGRSKEGSCSSTVAVAVLPAVEVNKQLAYSPLNTRTGMEQDFVLETQQPGKRRPRRNANQVTKLVDYFSALYAERTGDPYFGSIPADRNHINRLFTSRPRLNPLHVKELMGCFFDGILNPPDSRNGDQGWSEIVPTIASFIRHIPKIQKRFSQWDNPPEVVNGT